MTNYHKKVLVDSSVWIDFFKGGKDEKLSLLIENDLVCTNEVILTELLPGLIKDNHLEVLEGLESIENIHLEIDWSIIRKYKLINIKNGINKVGIPDLIILQQVIDKNITLYTFDKHFKLMQEHLKFDLI